MHQVQVAVAQMFDSVAEVLGEDVPSCSLSVAAFGAGNAEAVGKRSGGVRSAGSCPMSSAWREKYRSATLSESRACNGFSDIGLRPIEVLTQFPYGRRNTSPSATPRPPKKVFAKQPLRLRAPQEKFSQATSFKS